VFRLFIALCTADNLNIYGGDAKDAFAHSPGLSMPTFMKLDDAFRDWYLEQTGALLDKDPFFSDLMRSAVSHQGRVSAGQLWDLQTGLMPVSSRTAICG